jgi:uncharacterized protein
MPRGRVLELHRWPVKSFAGEPVDAVEVDRSGVAGDRAHALSDTFRDAPRTLTVRQAPRMLGWRAAYPHGPGEPPLVTAPDGRRFGWDDPALPGALSEDLGREVTLGPGTPDLPDSVLVTFEATRRAIEGELGPLDLRRFRTNLHVELEEAGAYAEEGWEGRTLRVGEVELALLHPCERCVIPTRHPDTHEKWPELLRWLTREHAGRFGINARPLGPATISVGDPVELL